MATKPPVAKKPVAPVKGKMPMAPMPFNKVKEKANKMMMKKGC